MNVSPELTIAICTHNRPQLLAQLLERLLPQAERLGIWTVVVDSASEAENARQVAAMLQTWPLARLIRLDRPGASLARNAALHAVTTPWLAFIDDDELPPPDWVEAALALCRRLPEDCAACGGNTLPRFPDGRASPKLGKRWRQYLSMVEMAGEFDQSASLRFPIGHSVIRVGAVRAIGGFDLRLGRDGVSLLSGEEVLLVDLLVAAGWRIWHSDRLTIEHMIEPERLERDWARRRAYWEGVSRARVLRLSDQAAFRALCRQVAQKAPALHVAAALFGAWAEMDLRWAFAAGVRAEVTGSARTPSPRAAGLAAVARGLSDEAMSMG